MKMQYILYKKIDVLLAIVLFIGCVCYLPLLLGTKYIGFGMIFLLIVTFVCIIRQYGIIHLAKKSGLRIYVTSMILFFYCLIQCVLLDSDRMQAAIQTCILLMFAVTVFYITLSDKKIKALFIKVMYYVLIFFVLSYIISAGLSFVVGWDKILITSFDYGYFIDSRIFFPFTTTYGSMAFNGVVFRRLLGFARESGIMQIFYIWAFYMADKYFVKYEKVRALMAFGVAACLSTTGFIVFGLSLVLYLDTKKILSRKMLVSLTLIAIAFYVLFYAQGTRIIDKAEGSIEQRLIGIEFGLNAFFEMPIFGGGFYSTLGDSQIQSGICALGSLGQVGIVGIGLWLCVFIFAYIDSNDKKRFIYTNTALFITALFAQPIVFAPVMYWFLFVDYDNDKIVLIRENSSQHRQFIRSMT